MDYLQIRAIPPQTTNLETSSAQWAILFQFVIVVS